MLPLVPRLVGACLALAPAGPAPQGLPPELAARAGECTVSFEEFDELCMNRHAQAEEGRAALEHLLEAELLDQLAREAGLAIPAEDIDRRMAELDSEIRSTGNAGGLEEELAEYRVERETFRRFLRLQIVQEVLARRALGIPPARPVPADQQELWLASELERRGTDFPAPPYAEADPVLARSGTLEVRRSELLPHLRQQLDPATVREDCYQLLLEKLLRARMPDLAPEALARAVAEELERRRAELARDPQYDGLSFEQVMAARGLRLDRLERDPAIVIAALARLWVDRTEGEEGLRAAYQAERGWFEDRYGHSLPLSILFKNAVAAPNPLQPRTFEEAERELLELAARIDGPEAFAAAAREHSDDQQSAERGGALGRVTRAQPGLPEELSEFAFAHPGAGLVGPLRLTEDVTGVALLWIGELSPPPAWEVMREHVHNELRKRLIEETLSESSVVTWLDAG
jgi:parvulin-like peptidyl-prolyl isomerase